MKRRIRGLDLIISVVVIVVGLLLVGWGVAHHGVRAVVWDSQSHGLVASRPVKRTVRPGNYSKIVINTKLPVTIRPGNVNQIQIQQANYVRGHHPVTTQQHRGMLTVSGGDTRTHGIVIHGLSITTDDEAFDANGHIVITVPKRTSLQQVTLKKSWTVRLEDLTVDRITGPTGGSFQAKNVTVKQPLSLMDGDADLYLTNVTAPQLKMQTDDGDVNIKQSHFKSQENQITSNEGDIYLTANQLGGGRVTGSDGDIHVKNNVVAHTLTVSSSEGDLYGLVAADAGVTANGTSDSDIQLFGRSRKSGTVIRPHAKSQYVFSTADDSDITVR